MVSFHNLGALLGRLSPRCTDPHPDVRTAAIDCIHTLLYIQLRYEGKGAYHFSSTLEDCAGNQFVFNLNCVHASLNGVWICLSA